MSALYIVSDLSSQTTSLWYSTELLHFPPPSYFIFIYWFNAPVFKSSSFGCSCPLFHTLVFILSPNPALGCLPWSSTKLRLFSHPVVLFCLYLSTTCFPVFTFSISHFAHIDGFLCFSLLHLLEILHSWSALLQSSTGNCTPPSLLPPAPTQLAGTMLLRLNTACTLPCINPVLGCPTFFLGSWPLKMGPIGSPETSVRNYYYLHNNTEECSSHLLHGWSLQSHKNKTDSIENWSVMCDFMSKTLSFCL